MDWYPFYVQVYQGDTLHLTCLQDGAYRRLIDYYYATRGPIPNNDVALARIVGLPVDEWLEISSAIRPFFKAKGGKLIHSRCEREIAEMVRRSQKRSAAGKKGQKIKSLKSQADSAHGQHVLSTLTLTKKEGDLVLDRDPVLTSNTLPPTTTPVGGNEAFKFHPRYGEVSRKVEEILQSKTVTPFVRTPIDKWLKAGADPEADIYPALEAKLGQWQGRNLNFFDYAVADALRARTTPLPEGRQKAAGEGWSPAKAIEAMREEDRRREAGRAQGGAAE